MFQAHQEDQMQIHLVTPKSRIPDIRAVEKAATALFERVQWCLRRRMRSPPPLWPATNGSAAAQRRASESAATNTADAAGIRGGACFSVVLQSRRQSFCQAWPSALAASVCDFVRSRCGWSPSSLRQCLSALYRYPRACSARMLCSSHNER
mmetsp:Transcript_13928/g.35936  ORF Transcript_13928/g.35936 Transcript_13928/m.35936 type:complete len:151 (+) Transcript_13928:4313-4765(+)